MKEQKFTRQELENARWTPSSYFYVGYFSAYCSLQGCCDGCNRRVRRLCQLKCMIEDLQKAIILRICKEAKE